MKNSAHYLDFEKPILEIVNRVRELKVLQEEGRDNLPVKNISEEIEELEVKEKTITRRIYRNLSAWQTVQVARHPNRPHAIDYIENILTDFVPLAGDRCFSEDAAMLSGLAKLNGQPVCVLGIEKGKTTKERVKYNFGMPRPEGYRKAKRIMELAHKFQLPLITFVDTPGAFPGIEAEERGQSEAIASCIEKLLNIDVPVVTVITGEGGSGGALAIAVADKVIMLEHSVYSVISPEGCASILWRNQKEVESAANALKLTAKDLNKLGVIDDIIKEPVGGAQCDHQLTYERVNQAISDSLSEINNELEISDNSSLLKSRREKFLAMGRNL